MILRALFAVLLAAAPFAYGARLTPEASAAFDRYIELTEARPRFFAIDADSDWKTKVRAGSVRIEQRTTRDDGKEIHVPDGMIQDWAGTTFIPGAHISQVKAVLQDYANYKNFYRPDVMESRQIARQGDEFDIFLRLYKKNILTAVMNANYHVRFGTLDARHMFVISRSTRIAEAIDASHPDAGEQPVGDDNGFLWRLNSYWRFEEADGGVYAECEAISLSRSVPGFLSWMIKGFLEKFPKESMLNTLQGTKAVVMKQAGK